MQKYFNPTEVCKLEMHYSTNPIHGLKKKTYKNTEKLITIVEM